MAFHLHRLNLRGRRLAVALGGIGHDRASSLANAQTPLTEIHVQEIAVCAGLGFDDIARPLTEAEHREWHFYRISAAHPTFVWQQARSLWQRHALSATAAAHIMGLSHTHVRRCMQRNPSPLQYPPAARLADHLTPALDTDVFLPAEESFSQFRTTSVTRPTR